ncbi:MAG: 3-phosphoshikimate 1-carboxyvinyltransferase [Symbiobacteriia bacterium]
MTTFRIEPRPRLQGGVQVPGDKSISHRAALFAALAEGTSQIDNYSPGADCQSTLACLGGLGVSWRAADEGISLQGRGLFGLVEPTDVLPAGNSGTTMRLLSGVLAGQSFFSVLTGDDSLRSRPMRRIVDPLRSMGAMIQGRQNGQFAPLAIDGRPLHAIDYRTPVASAQIKSSILLAACLAEGTTTLSEPHLSRDHSERLLAWMGARIDRDGLTLRLQGRPRLQARHFQVPGDLSAAAFYLAAAGLLPDSEVEVAAVGINPTRTGILDVLAMMGLRVEMRNTREQCAEPVADLAARHAPLQAVEIGGDLIPRCIDEIPILAVLATQAQGTTVIRDAAELRVKETDRLATVARELRSLGANIQEQPDGLVIEGPTRLRGGRVHSHGDHRLAMSLAIAALVCDQPVEIEDADCARISDPLFFEQLARLGVKLGPTTP